MKMKCPKCRQPFLTLTEFLLMPFGPQGFPPCPYCGSMLVARNLHRKPVMLAAAASGLIAFLVANALGWHMGYAASGVMVLAGLTSSVVVFFCPTLYFTVVRQGGEVGLRSDGSGDKIPVMKTTQYLAAASMLGMVIVLALVVGCMYWQTSAKLPLLLAFVLGDALMAYRIVCLRAEIGRGPLALMLWLHLGLVLAGFVERSFLLKVMGVVGAVASALLLWKGCRTRHGDS